MTNQLSYNNSRVENNIRAIAYLTSNQLKKKNVQAEMLKQYSGWGGLREAIYTPKVYKQLKNMLHDDDINSIKSTLKTAYFTPKLLVKFIYQVILQMGCSPKKILEPSAGHGVFIEHMPKVIRKNACTTAIEIDKVSCQLLKALHNDVNVQQTGFEGFALSKEQGKFDLIIGNPPFGQFYVNDSNNSDLSKFSIHHYFVGKCMRMLKKDGVLAMVLPRYFLDAPQKHVRQIIANEGGSLVAAYRLPDDLFDDAKVTIDVVFLKKDFKKSANQVSWIKSKKVAEGKAFAFINQYFLDNPKNIIGKLDFFEVYGRTEITCKKTSDVRTALLSKLADFSDFQKNNNQQLDSKKIQQQFAILSKKIAMLQKEYKQLSSIKEKIEQFETQLDDLYNLSSNW